MAQEFLNGANIAPVFKEMCSEGVAEGVWRGTLGKTDPADDVEYGAL
jgi:hypothetical protein